MSNEISVRSYSISNIPHDTETYELRASVVGIGQAGAETVHLFLRLLCSLPAMKFQHGRTVETGNLLRS